jgi:acetylornithine deacetylase/succinyl-diaminopimelate desuccinylase-like protein
VGQGKINWSAHFTLKFIGLGVIMPSSKSILHTLKTLYREQQANAFEDFKTFLKFPSISSEQTFQPQVKECAAWLSTYIKKLGFEIELWEGKGHPVIFASHMQAGDDKPTLLIYNHYDVQPIDPLEEWTSPPFEPTERDGQVYARGAQDNKGQCFYVLQALKLLLLKDQKFPINIKLCIEGEEECGSHHLTELLKVKSKELHADYLAIVDLGMPKPNQPAVTLGVRGIATMDVEVCGSTCDLHSGSHGGLAYNPIRALTEVLSKLHDSFGKVTVPGFYDGIQEMTSEEKEELALTFDQNEYKQMFGIHATGGEQVFEPLEREWLRPTLEINGINGGYSGAGFKTVIPAKAMAKISCRTVPGQQYQDVAAKVARHIESLAPEGIHVKVHVHSGGGEAVRSAPDSKIIQAAAQAYQEVFERPCQYILTGASIPIAAELAKASGSEIVLMGLGLADDLIHAPNEHFGMDRLENGCLSIARMIELLNVQA